MTSRQLIEISGVSKYKLPFLLYSAKRLIHKSLNEMPVCPGMYETIYELKKRGFYIGIISSNTESNIEKYLEMKNINIFNFVKGERNIFGKAKVIKKMMEKKRLNPDETIYVGDEIFLFIITTDFIGYYIASDGKKQRPDCIFVHECPVFP